MAIFDLFSKRQKRLRGEVPDIYIYDSVPEKLRVQIVHIIQDCLGKDGLRDDVHTAYKSIYEILCREYGRFKLVDNQRRPFSEEEQVLNFLLQTTSTDEALDVIEIAFKYIDRIIKPDYHSYKFHTKSRIEPDDAISELNERFKENGIGYSFEAGEIIRIDSTYTHSEITKPTLTLLSNSKFRGANEEYLKAHEHYRDGRNKECLAECLKAFESSMKVICQEKGWAFSQNDPAKKLIQICFQNGLVPSFTQNQFTGLQNLLDSGVPTVRNKLGGHGQGQVPQQVDDGITRYGLNLTGTNIIFLIEQSGL